MPQAAQAMSHITTMAANPPSTPMSIRPMTGLAIAKAIANVATVHWRSLLGVSAVAVSVSSAMAPV